MAQEWVKVAQTGDLAPGEMMVVLVRRQRILLANVEGKYWAISDACPHAGAFLSVGTLIGNRLICTLHGSCFNIENGAPLNPPAMDYLSRYPVRVDGEDILVSP